MWLFITNYLYYLKLSFIFKNTDFDFFFTKLNEINMLYIINIHLTCYLQLKIYKFVIIIYTKQHKM